MKDILIFTDGASSGNPGPGGWGAIICTPEGHVTELGGSNPQTTNNRMEITAALEALRAVKDLPGRADVYTDSVYLIRGITQWIWGWQKRGWKTAEGAEVANADLWRTLWGLVIDRDKKVGKTGWHFVRGHAGIPGNERCDEIAVAFTRGKRPSLYRGPLIQYGVPIHDLPEDTSIPESALKPKEKKAQAYSYLSLVNGVARRHSSWAECEAQVKGRSGAKFKKAMSAQEEEKILRSWGVSPDQL